MNPSPKWVRSAPLSQTDGTDSEEIWTSTDPASGDSCVHPLRVRLGKPLNVLELKSDVLAQYGAAVEKHRRRCEELFSGELERVISCPICGESTEKSERRLSVYRADYHECAACRHHFVIRRPSRDALDAFYSRGEALSPVYVDDKSLTRRLDEVSRPKAEWMLDAFRRRHGRLPRRVVDVGAGGGHFVQVCREKGIEAEGVELSGRNLEFCRDRFGFDLIQADFVKEWTRWAGAEIITFWGVLEHTPDPMSFLAAAGRALSRDAGVVVAAVPRWECMGTAVQSIFTDSIVRHLDPSGHLHVFSDDSLATALVMNRLTPIAAWYYGMDAYELVSQLAHRFRNGDAIQALGRQIGEWQSRMDRAHFSDEIAVAAIFTGDDVRP
ncbi:class I SAM-dependent methyltransferase [bacterium]|nr:class I SAM-dependent methyltransferase [bacterium]